MCDGSSQKSKCTVVFDGSFKTIIHEGAAILRSLSFSVVKSRKCMGERPGETLKNRNAQCSAADVGFDVPSRVAVHT